jgi:hypothetical protein
MSEEVRDAPAPDALALRALAHPVRWKLIDVLTTEGTVTATRCSELIGESTATCSYHLSVLAKYGYITRVASAQWREKPWRLVTPDLNLSASELDDERSAASRAAAAAFVDYEMNRLKDSLRRGAQAPEGWPGTQKIMATTAWLTAGELRQLIAEIGQVLDKYGDRGRASAERPETARPARLFAAVALMPSDQTDD